nr:ADP-ribosyltransferase [Parabacteroides goldsteinii]
MNKYDSQHNKNLDKYARKVNEVYKTAVAEAAAIGQLITKFDPSRPFTFNDYPQTKDRIEKLMKSLQKGVEVAIVDGVNSEWTLANNKNNELCRRVFGDNIGKLTKKQERKYFNNNDVARQAFLARKESGLNLSDRVWKYTGQFKEEIEMGLDLGLRDGLPATAMARDLKKYLQEPDKLFRRVRDEHGQLHLSKKAKAYHPGAGVYRSSHKNAMRLARIETNMAYRNSDYERWQQQDFVVGIEVKLSNNHPVSDICNTLAGKYPKEFRFDGWHPHCRCHAVTLLKTPEEMAEDTDRILAGEEPSTDSVNRVTELPPNYTDWVEENKDRILGASSKPYFIRNNYENGDINGDLVWKSKAKEIEAQKAREAAQQAAKALALSNKMATNVLSVSKGWPSVQTKQLQELVSAGTDTTGLRAEAKAVAKAIVEARKYAKELALANKMGKNVLSVAKEWPDLDISALEQLVKQADNAALLKGEAKTIAKAINAAKKEDAVLYLTQPTKHGLIKEFGQENAENFLKAWDKYTSNKALLSDEAYLKVIDKEIYYGKLKINKYVTSPKMVYFLEKEKEKVLAEIAHKELIGNCQQVITGAKGFKGVKLKKATAELQELIASSASDVDITNKLAEAQKELQTLETKKALRELKKGLKGVDAAAYTPERKAKALKFTSQHDADAYYRAKAGEVWKSASEEAKQGLYEYTYGSGSINWPLRGWDRNGAGLYGKSSWIKLDDPMKHLAKQKGSWSNKPLDKLVEGATQAISKSKYDKDMWLFRGTNFDELDNLLSLPNGTFESLVYSGNDKALGQFIGQVGVEKAFTSTGGCFGTGFPGSVKMRIYAPAGTEVMYCEPFSHYGCGHKYNWNGSAKQSGFGDEFEMLINRGYRKRISAIKRTGMSIEVEIEILDKV